MRARLVLPRPGGPGEQHVVERLAAGGRGGDGDAELLLERLLADEVGEPLRAQRGVQLVLPARRLRRVWMRRVGAPACGWLTGAPP